MDEPQAGWMLEQMIDASGCMCEEAIGFTCGPCVAREQLEEIRKGISEETRMREAAVEAAHEMMKAQTAMARLCENSVARVTAYAVKLAEERDHLQGAYAAGERWLREIEHNFETCEMRHLPDAIWAVRIAAQALGEMRRYRGQADEAYRAGAALSKNTVAAGATSEAATTPSPLGVLPQVVAAYRAVETAELFEDGLSADLHDCGVSTPPEAYMQGRTDALVEFKQALAERGVTIPEADDDGSSHKAAAPIVATATKSGNSQLPQYTPATMRKITMGPCACSEGERCRYVGGTPECGNVELPQSQGDTK